MDDKLDNLKLLSGDPLYVEDIGEVYPLTLAQIKDMGMDNYNKLLYVATFSRSMLEKSEETISDFEYVLAFYVRDKEFKDTFELATKAFLRADVELDNESTENDIRFILSNGKYLNDVLFEQFKTIIRKQNFLDNTSKEEYNPANEKAASIAEKLRKAKEKVIKKKSNKEGQLSLADIISIVSTHSKNINIFNVWDMTVYQLYAHFNRMMQKDGYEQQFEMMLHFPSTDNKSLDLKHWATSL